MKKILNLLLILSFFVTVMVPVTGIHIHKLASTLFLLLCLIHAFVYKNKVTWKRYGLICLIIISFLSGLFGMIFEEISFILISHRVISICIIFFLAIHIYIFRRRHI